MKYIKKDITTVDSGIVVQGVNCQGVMGSGVAGAIRRKWPKAYESYMDKFHQTRTSNSDLLGTVDFALITTSPTLYVANIFSQKFYGSDGQTYANPISILQGMTRVFQFAEAHDLPIHSVKIGSGLGGLDWKNDVEPIFRQLECAYPLVPIYLHEI
jgi:O-acetyl-ADP-ribose deacetylase (regulator of RNase III)